MGLRLYLFSLIATIIISFGLWLLLLFNADPFQAPSWIIVLFYLTYCLFLTSLITLILFYYKVWASNREVIFNHLIPSIRQSFFVAVILTLILFFQQIKVLNWWIVALLVVTMIFLELIFRSKKTKKII